MILKLQQGMDILYKDLKGNLSLYKVLDVHNSNSFNIKQNQAECRDKLHFSKQFDSSFKHKDGRVKLFPLWLNFGEIYIFERYKKEELVRLQSYVYIDSVIHFDFKNVKTNAVYTLTFKECCEKIKFNTDGRE